MPALPDAAAIAAAEYVLKRPIVSVNQILGNAVSEDGRLRKMTPQQREEIATLQHLILDTLGQIEDGHGAESLDRNGYAPSLSRRLTRADFLAVCGKALDGFNQ